MKFRTRRSSRSLRQARRLEGRRSRRRLRGLPEKLQRDPQGSRRCAGAADLRRALQCLRARRASPPAARSTATQARKFFEDNFKPVRILPEAHSLRLLHRRRRLLHRLLRSRGRRLALPDRRIHVPLYRRAGRDVAGKEEQGVLAITTAPKSRTARWPARTGNLLDQDPVDAFFAQIQGSTRVRLDDGDLLRLNYIASNGQPYTPVGRLLIDHGVVHARRNVDGPDPRVHGGQSGRGRGAAREQPLLHVFPGDAARTTTNRSARRAFRSRPGARSRSIARSTSTARRSGSTPNLPIASDEPRTPFQHLMFAQDTGSAIRRAGARRYLFRPRRGHPAHRRPHQAFGKFVMLVPQGRVGAAAAAPGDNVPLPRPRPKDSRRRQCGHGRKPAAQPKPQAMSRRDGSRRRVLSSEERVLWTTVHQSDRAVARRRAHRRGRRRRKRRPAPRPRRRRYQRAVAAGDAEAAAKPPRAPLAPLGRRMKQQRRARQARRSTRASICTG